MSAFLTDFGLARLASTGSRLTRTGQALGTPAYMSPEQARGEVSSLSSATDVWSLGCVLYEMLAGRRPFEGRADAEVVGRVLLGEPPRLRALQGDLPEPIERVARVCLAKRARVRYRDAAALREDLDRVLYGERPRARIPGGRRRWVAAAGLACVAAVGAAAAARHEPSPLAAPPVSGASGSGPSDRGDVEALATRAQELAASDAAESAKLLRRALALDPGRRDLRVQLGLRLWVLGEGAAARAEWEAVPESAPERGPARFYLGLESVCSHRANEARGDLREVMDGAGPYQRLAAGLDAYLRADYEAARAALRDADGWEADLIRGSVENLAPSGDQAAAARQFRRALERGIRFAWTHHTLGNLLRDSGDLPAAEREYTAAILLAPNRAECHFSRALVRLDLKDFPGALDDFDRGLEIGGPESAALRGRAIARLRIGDLPGALGGLDEALRLDPEDANAWDLRGSVHQAAGSLAEAVEDHTKAHLLAPGHASILHNRGNARRSLGQLREALEDYSASLERDPTRVETWVNRGWTKYDLGDLPGALADYDRALALSPGHFQALNNRGNAREALGDAEGALGDFRAAIERNPAEPRLFVPWLNLGRALRGLSRWDDAAVAFEAFLRLAPDHPRAGWARQSLAECRERGSAGR